MMRLALLLALLAGSCGAVWARDFVPLTAEQIQHLGIRTDLPEKIGSMPLAWAPGRVVVPPEHEFLISAPLSGLIRKVNVALGARVRKGQILAEMQSPEWLGAQGDLLDATTEFNLAAAQLHRDESLLREGIISRLRWQETRSQHDKAQTKLRQAEQVLLLLGMGADELKKLESTRRLDDVIRLRSPVDGVVLERRAVAGQRVDLQTPLFRVAEPGPLWLEIDMPQERIREIRIGDRVSLANPKIEARITQVSQNITPNSQSVLVRAVIEQKGENVMPGQNVNVQVSHASTDVLARVPISALVNHAGKQYMFVREPAGFAVHEVAVASVEARDVVVHEGLPEDREVAVQGVAALKAAWLGLGGDE